MIRWLVKKIVKYVLEELMNSEDLQWLIHRYGSRVSLNPPGSDLRSVPHGDAPSGAVEVDSMERLAKVMAAKTSDVEIGIKNESETVSPNKRRSADTMRRLSEIGD